MVFLLIAYYLAGFAVLLAGASLIFWLLARLFDAHKRTAIVLSLVTGILSAPMVINGHGIAFVTLAFGMFSDYASFTDSTGFRVISVLCVTIMASITFIVLNRISKRMCVARDYRAY